MQAQISARHVHVSEQMQRHVDEKIEHLSRYADQVRSCAVTLSKDGESRVVEIVISARRGQQIVAEGRADNFYKSMDLAADKAERQLARRKDRMKGHRARTRVGEALETEEEEPETAESGPAGPEPGQ